MSGAFSCMILKWSVFSLLFFCLCSFNVCLSIQWCYHPTIVAVYAKLRYIYFLTSWIKLNPNYHFEQNVLKQKTWNGLNKEIPETWFLSIFIGRVTNLWVVRGLNHVLVLNSTVFGRRKTIKIHKAFNKAEKFVVSYEWDFCKPSHNYSICQR